MGVIKKNPKLVMTLLARDEGDIIRRNIEFHLSHGVDFIIATDNASSDNTRDILTEYKNKGKLYLIDEFSSVGDFAFQKKCEGFYKKMKENKKQFCM